MVNQSGGKEKALNSVAELLKLITSLATGALVFSIGFEGVASVTFPIWLKVMLVFSWVFLLTSVVAGVWSQSLIPLQLDSDTPDIDSKDLRYPAIVMEIFFTLGIAFFSVTLAISVFVPSHFMTIKVKTAADALHYATLVKCENVSKVAAVELIKGEDVTDPSQAVWHVQLELKPTSIKTKLKSYKDIFVKAEDAEISSPQVPCKRSS